MDTDERRSEQKLVFLRSRVQTRTDYLCTERAATTPPAGAGPSHMETKSVDVELTKSGGPSSEGAGHGADAAPVVPEVVQSHNDRQADAVNADIHVRV